MPTIQCHYEILGVPKDADDATIKKSHRKMALKWHPDKNLNDPETAAEQFRLVQQAYECLSDTQERKWYDDHRDAILNGWTGSGGDENGDAGAYMLFQVVPFMHPGCYSGYHNEEGGFFQVYGKVINEIVQCELKQDEQVIHLPTDFGNADSEWDLVLNFYQQWESFQSALNFAWEDIFNTMEDAPDRRIRRLMEEENKKARRAAKKTYNRDILALVAFVKRRDPRVKAKQRELEEKKLEQQRKQKQEAEERKQQHKEAKEAWKEEQEQALAQAEEEDLAAGRVRLADLDDDYDYGGGKKKGKRGRGKKNKKKNQVQDDWDNQGGEEVTAVDGAGEEGDGNDQEAPIEPLVEAIDGAIEQDAPQAPEPADEVEDDGFYSSEEEPVWRCEVCKKDFKSEGQLKNHMQSKKHKQAVKKYAAKMNLKEDEVMAEMMAALGR